jgi:hypothetical protein
MIAERAVTGCAHLYPSVLKCSAGLVRSRPGKGKGYTFAQIAHSLVRPRAVSIVRTPYPQEATMRPRNRDWTSRIASSALPDSSVLPPPNPN